MNAAFVILTSALLGNHPAAAPCNGCSAPAPVVACSTCSSGHSFGSSLRSQLSGLFTCHSCSAPAPCAAPAPVCAAPAPCSTCSSCGHGSSWGSGQLLGKLRGAFSHHTTSCDTCSAPAAPACDSCGSAPAAPAAAPAPAPADAPKKMPDAPKADAPKGDKAVRYEDTPETPLSIPGANPVINSRPSVIVAPATLRNPF